MEPSGCASRYDSASVRVTSKPWPRQTSTIASLMSTPRAAMPLSRRSARNSPRPHPRSSDVVRAAKDRQVFGNALSDVLLRSAEVILEAEVLVAVEVVAAVRWPGCCRAASPAQRPMPEFQLRRAAPPRVSASVSPAEGRRSTSAALRACRKAPQRPRWSAAPRRRAPADDAVAPRERTAPCRAPRQSSARSPDGLRCRRGRSG